MGLDVCDWMPLSANGFEAEADSLGFEMLKYAKETVRRGAPADRVIDC
jgi:hypothetical protein